MGGTNLAKKKQFHEYHYPARPQSGNLQEGCSAAAEAHQAGAGALQGARAEGVERRRRRLHAATADAVGGDDRLVQLLGRFRAALGAVLGHAAPARQQLRREHAGGIASGPALRLRDGVGRALVRAPGQLRAGAHRSAGRRDGRSEAAALRHHRSARGPRPGHRRLQGRLAGGRGAARRPSGLFRDFLPRAAAGADTARRVRRGAAVRAQGAQPASGQRQARDRRQLSGRLGGDDAGGRRPGRHGPDRDQRRADVLLGRRLAGRRGRQPDALQRAACWAARGSRRSPPTWATGSSTAPTSSRISKS